MIWVAAMSFFLLAVVGLYGLQSEQAGMFGGSRCRHVRHGVLFAGVGLDVLVGRADDRAQGSGAARLERPASRTLSAGSP